MRNNRVIKNGKVIKISNAIAYMHRATQGSYPAPYVTKVVVRPYQRGGAMVAWVLSDGRIVIGQWASMNVLQDYIERRSRKLRGVDVEFRGARFNRRDIQNAHYALEVDWHISGVLQERPSNQRRRMSSDYQIHRMNQRAHITYTTREQGYAGLTFNAKAIYRQLQARYGLG